MQLRYEKEYEMILQVHSLFAAIVAISCLAQFVAIFVVYHHVEQKGENVGREIKIKIYHLLEDKRMLSQRMIMSEKA